MVEIQGGRSNVYYHGDSMVCTFEPGDYLLIRPACLKDIQPGDVVVFNSRYDEQVVHRVMAHREEGFITCGDNNTHFDLEPVTQGNLIGVVTDFVRNGKKRPVIGGSLGLLRFRTLRLACDIWKSIKSFGCYPYRLARRDMKRLIERIWQPHIEQMTIILEQETVVKFLHRGRTVARWWPSRHYFECRKPYDLVIPDPEKK